MLLTLSAVFGTALLQIAAVQGLPTPPAGGAGVRAVRAAAPVTVDGALQDPAWATAQVVSGFRQRDPEEGAAPTEPTEVRVLYDDVALYVGARLFDAHPDSIIARLARRDNGVTSDAFVLFLDPYHDRRTGYFFGVNAAGSLFDGTLLNDDWDDDTWDGNWDAKVQRDSLGWSVEMRIPYSQLRFQQSEQYIWGINFKREIARRNETSYLVMVPRTESGFVSHFSDLTGMERVRPPRRLEVLPYVTSKAEFLEHAPNDPFNDGSRLGASAGADFKLGLGSNVTLDATVNPDFGQVEVDPAVVNLSDVETFYPEKRPFFVEGASIFDFGSGGANNNWGFNFPRPDLFYSRRIGRAPSGGLPDASYADVPSGTTILGATKLSGKLGGAWNFGVLSALTDREEARLDAPGGRFRTGVEPLTSYSVLRAQREFGQGRRSLGLIATSTVRSLGDPVLQPQFNRDAFSVGVDGWTFLDAKKMWVVTGLVAGTRVSGSTDRITALQESAQHYYQRPDASHISVDSNATTLTGWMSRFALNKQSGNWQFNAALGTISPGFDANDIGFQFRTDVINGHVVGGYAWTQPGKLFRNSNVNLATFRSYDFEGNKTWTGLFSNFNGQLRNYYQIHLNGSWNPQTINTRRTRGGPLTLNPAGQEIFGQINSDDRRSVVFGVSGGGGNFAGPYWNIGPSIEWKPATQISLSFEPSVEWQRSDAQYVSTVDDPSASRTFGHRYVFAELEQTTVSGSFRINWTFTPRLSLELYAQPLIASGNYRGYKELARPKSFAFDRYGLNGSTITPVTDPDGIVQEYTVDPTGSGTSTFAVPNLDFSFASLRGNAVLRWEYLTGSTLYLVWTQDRSDFAQDGDFRLGHSLSQLAQAHGNHIFAVKLSYWWHP
ncbi:MAG: DUF5916 domain-containing protein [Gemmatimonadales bacterium]